MQGFLQSLINVLVGVLNVVFGWLPDSPLHFVSSGQFAGFIAKINYFLPIYEFIAIAEAWLVAVGMYYGASVVLRWIKAVE